MTEEDRKRYFGILVENLYSMLQLLSESTLLDKKEKAAKLIHEFYKEHKERYKINDIEDITEELDKVDIAMKKSGNNTDIKRMYDDEGPGNR